MNEHLKHDLTKSIAKYFSFIENHLFSISNISTDRYSPIYQKILYLSLLDMMARVPFRIGGAGDKFRNFILAFCDWDDSSRISTPHLYKFLTEVPEEYFPSLRKFVQDHLASWPAMRPINLTNDLDVERLSSHDLKDWERWREIGHRLSKLPYNSFAHVSLLWQARNQLVHEIEEPGYGMGFGDEETPFYYQLNHSSNIVESSSNFIELIDSGVITRELVYPTHFFRELVINGMRNLREHCEREQIDPYDAYTFGSYWLDPLNEKL